MSRRYVRGMKALSQAVGAVSKASEIYGKYRQERAIAQQSVLSQKNMWTPRRTPGRSRSMSVSSAGKSVKFRMPTKVRLATKAKLMAKYRSKYNSSLHSKSSGKFVRKMRISKRQSKKGKRYNKGVAFTKETGITVSGYTDSCYLGHTTFCQLQMKLGLYRTLIKAIFAKKGIAIRNFLDGALMIVGDAITVQYKVDQQDATAQTFYNAFYAVGTTYESLAQSLNTQFSNAGPEYFLLEVSYYSATTSSTIFNINLANASVKIDVKSNLKIQNVTAAVAGQEADAVNNVPLYGRAYYGHGTGTVSNRSAYTETSLVANEDNGIIFKGGSVNSGTSEMPPPAYFKQCKGSSKAKLEPGEIKTSVLTQVQSYPLTKFVKFLYTGQALTKDFLNTGSFAFFGFEHMIKATAADPTITLKAEHNYHYTMTMKTRFVNITDEKCEQNYVTF